MSSTRCKWSLGLMLVVVALGAGTISMEKGRPQGGFAFDFPKYKGARLGAMLRDIGYTPIGSRVTHLYDSSRDTGLVYTGCNMAYSQGVEIFVHFDTIVHQPPDRHGVIRDLDYFKDETIKDLEVVFTCSPTNEE